MEIKSDFETYLLLSPQKKEIAVYDKQNFKNLYLNKNLEIETINGFLEKNIFVIEKKFQNFVEKINLILENDEFFTLGISIKKNNY